MLPPRVAEKQPKVWVCAWLMGQLVAGLRTKPFPAHQVRYVTCFEKRFSFAVPLRAAGATGVFALHRLGSPWEEKGARAPAGQQNVFRH